MLKLLGLLIIMGSLSGDYLLVNSNPVSLWQPMQVLIIVGGGVGTFLIANPWYVVHRTIRYLITSINGTRKYNTKFYQQLLSLLFELFELRRKSGSGALEQHIEHPETSPLFMASKTLKNPRLTQFICDNLRIVALGRALPHELESLLDDELHTMIEDYQRSVKALQGIADALPGFGIATAIFGAILTMHSIELDTPHLEVAMQIASSLIGSFLGILLCYGVLTPLARSLDHTIHAEVQLFECVKAAILALVYGRPSAIAVDAGRRMIYSEVRPSFEQMETWLSKLKEPVDIEA